MSHPAPPARPRRAGVILGTVALGLVTSLAGCTSGTACDTTS